MMYSEFLEISNITENDITYDTYSKVIEPMYMASNLNKNDFVSILNLETIKTKYDNVNLVKKKIVNIIDDMKKKLGHYPINVEEENFISLVKTYCRIRGLTFCYITDIEYEFPMINRGCTMYTGFVACIGDPKTSNFFKSFKVIGNKLVEK